MVERKDVPPEWPPVSGEYAIGDPKNPVAVSSLGTYFDDKKVLGAGAVMVGPTKTENIGLEKIIANTISNPNIRFLILAGTEVPGHLTGKSMLALAKDGVDPNSKKIINAPGAIPFIENASIEAVERFRAQVEVIDMIGVEDLSKIGAKIKELIEKDPGAFPEDPMIIRLGAESEEKEEAELPLAMPATPVMDTFNKTIESIRYKSQLIVRDQKLTSGLSNNAIVGILTGIILAVIISLPLILLR